MKSYEEYEQLYKQKILYRDLQNKIPYLEKQKINSKFISINMDQIYQIDSNDVKGGNNDILNNDNYTKFIKKQYDNNINDNNINDVNNTGYIYVCTTYEYQKKSYYKVGKTKNVFNRTEDYKDGKIPKDRIFMLISIKCDFMDHNIFEKYCHDRLSRYRLDGCEYFHIKFPVLKILLEMFIINMVMINKQV